MKRNVQKKRLWLHKVAFLILILLCAIFNVFAPARAKTVRADFWYDDPVIKVHRYDVDVTVNKDRTVRMVETFDVEFLSSEVSMFYRSLPIENTRYFDISARCDGNPSFSYYVADNPDYSDFIDINCEGGVYRGARREYVISYSMQNGSNAATKDNGMIIDVVGFGTTVEINNVTITVHFPYATTMENCKTYVGYGSTTPTSLGSVLSADGKTLTMSISRLGLEYVPEYDVEVAKGVTLDFTLTGGTFDAYLPTRLFTDGTLYAVLGGLLLVAGSVCIYAFMRKKTTIIPVVNVKAPKGFDPLKMGKTIDGNVDTEDITSMIYYFAHHGYLDINFEDEKNPVLIKKADLPDSAPVYQKTLFNGIFKRGKIGKEVSVSELEYEYYEAVDKAKKQVAPVKIYDKKSLTGYVLGGVFALLYALFIGVLLSATRIGNGYISSSGYALALPIILILIFNGIRENYRYKWKKVAVIGEKIGEVLLALISSVIYVVFVANHVFTEYEKAFVCVFLFLSLFLCKRVLSRREDYVKTLGDILGFKEFIVVTEEDKIKFMLEDNPQLFYEILPYAQVLGVTNEWQDKFKNIVIEPPTWCHGVHLDVFDYMLINSYMRMAMVTALTRPEPKGSGIGRSGGGGHFGGFGGGGFGGGGFGAR